MTAKVVKRKPRWSECFSLATVAGTADNTFALIMPPTRGKVAWPRMAGPDVQQMGLFVIPTRYVSVAISEVKSGYMNSGRGTFCSFAPCQWVDIIDAG